MTETPEYNLPVLIKQLQEIQANPPGSLDEEKKKFFIENLTNVYHGLARVLSNFSMEYLDDHDFEDELFQGEMKKRSEKRSEKITISAKEEAAAATAAAAAAAAAAAEGAAAEGAAAEGAEGAAAAEGAERAAAAEGAEGAEGAQAAPVPAAAEGAQAAQAAPVPAKASPSSGGNKNSKTQKRKNQSQNKTQKNR